MFALRATVSGLMVTGLLAGCASSVPLEDNKAKVETRTPTPVDPNANANAASQSQVTPVDLNKGNNAAADSASRIVYFDFDSFVVKDEYRPVVEANAKRLMADKKRHVTIEGHTDERGGAEYNLALGQKRAEAVAKSLELMGVGDKQIEPVSYGKERPADQGHDEAAWAKNRRAELKDR